MPVTIPPLSSTGSLLMPVHIGSRDKRFKHYPGSKAPYVTPRNPGACSRLSVWDPRLRALDNGLQKVHPVS
jgi:hypothetical protein